MEIIIKIIILSLAVVGEQYLIRAFCKCFDKRMYKSDKRIRDYLLTQNGEEKIKKNKYDLVDFYKESTGLFLIKEKRKDLKFITIAIGVIEITFFSGLTLILIQGDYNFPNIFMKLTTFAGAWIGLKVFGNYQQWSGSIFGRACFYNFLIGSILNIIAAVIIGYYMATGLFI